mmetsp:Transcript_10243/g.21075  ORF Transcript_10243/g.21075 Transcript_10243/m.21075 type:complete len:171 (-) Transcript_10243:427-939(-)|eukprot:CAMPEP_0171329804 /NCGR_PEP_ID=MMETSP0878-20121228/1549_1 /TAXON_ID=67004 /ORGANISM="Thalassiosira weissflogii, Strain CCMP1336" /LENGTH=170 /DNA_ID=CAMNT_0011829921 /DNA_START=38 /DNA_END=550 /DNA_ORIENTATION=-
MAKFSSVLVSSLLLSGSTAYAPNSVPKAKKPAFDAKRVAASSFAAASIASSLVLSPIAEPVDAMDVPSFGTSTVVAERVTREGLYREYEVDVEDQVYDDARSTYKSAKETKTKKGKYTALIAVLVVGSFIIPMAQYFWYVRDDDSSDKFFGKAEIPEPEPEPKKKGWFGK